MSVKYLVILAAVLAGAGYWVLRPASEKPDITEAQAQALAEKAFTDVVSEYKLKGWDYVFKKPDAPPTDPAWRYNFQWLNEKTEPRQQVVILVSKKGETSPEVSALPPRTEEEVAVIASAGLPTPEPTSAGADGHGEPTKVEEPVPVAAEAATP